MHVFALRWSSQALPRWRLLRWIFHGRLGKSHHLPTGADLCTSKANVWISGFKLTLSDPKLLRGSGEALLMRGKKCSLWREDIGTQFQDGGVGATGWKLDATRRFGDSQPISKAEEMANSIPEVTFFAPLFDDLIYCPASQSPSTSVAAFGSIPPLC